MIDCRTQNLDIPRAVRDGAGRGGSVRIRPRDIGFSCSPGKPQTTVLDDSSEERPNEMLMTTGLSSRRPLFVTGCLPVDRRLFVAVNPFHARCVRENWPTALHLAPAHWFPDMPCMKKVSRDNWATAHWSASRNEERSWSRG